MNDDQKLIRRFVDAMERLDDSFFTHSEPPPLELASGIDPEDWNRIIWKPKRVDTSRDALHLIHSRIRPLPVLFEELVLSYRWVEVHLSACLFFGNPPGTDLRDLADQMFGDPVMNATLLPAGFARFGLAPNGSYDPICFDVKRFTHGDCPVVRFNHESILIHGKLGSAEQVFDSFRDMIVAIASIEG
jgi:hypothetical protein